MKARPILFSAPMVRALLDGSKTQTRRIAPIESLDIRPLEFASSPGVSWAVTFTKPMGPSRSVASYSGAPVSEAQARSIIASQFCPYGQPGDRLWVREAWRSRWMFNKTPPRDISPLCPVHYESGGTPAPGDGFWGKLRPSIFMPRWASRITLELTGVRVERLQDISEADALAEGVDMVKLITMPFSHAIPWASVTLKPRSARQAYMHLWESINGLESVIANPWVWVLEFRRVTNG